jgi:hypothetical protein
LVRNVVLASSASAPRESGPELRAAWTPAVVEQERQESTRLLLHLDRMGDRYLSALVERRAGEGLV